ncbi:MAG TPA: aldehyde dehydrogenase [bacterium]|nr:aldehyde dehydrogenase [bacterium]
MTYDVQPKLFINGEFADSAGDSVFPVKNPANNEVVAEVPDATAADVESAVAAASEAFNRGTWPRLEAAERSAIVYAIGDGLARNAEALARLDTMQSGRTLNEMRGQFAKIPDWFRYFAGIARGLEGRVLPMPGNYLNYTQRIPLGVVAQITPWNHPMLILAKKVAPALAAGNTVVIKPSEYAPLSALALASIGREAGLPPGVLNVVTGFGPSTGSALVSHPAVAKVDMTGGVETGRAVASAAGRNLADVTAELGGKAPVIIFPDVELPDVVTGAVLHGYYASGQACAQGSRVLIHADLLQEFTEHFVQRVRQLRVGDPVDKDTEIGPLVSKRQLERVHRYCQIGVEEGATLLCGGQPLDQPPYDRGNYFAPTVFGNVQPRARIAQEEIFGPVTVIIPFRTEEEAIQLANDVPFGLVAAIWTKDVKRAHRVAHQVQAGIIWINDCNRADPCSPWGGMKDSGIGRENGWGALIDYTQERSIIVNLEQKKAGVQYKI